MAALETPVACCAPLGAPALDGEEALATAELFKALGDPARVRIVNLLATSSAPVRPVAKRSVNVAAVTAQMLRSMDAEAYPLVVRICSPA